MQTKATRTTRPAEPIGQDEGDSQFSPWLRPKRPATNHTAEVEQGLAYLQLLAADDDVLIARCLVQFSLEARAPRGVPPTRLPGVSVLNRRRRAARLWVNAILAGDLSRETLRSLTHVWLPQLAGTGPEPRRAAWHGRRSIEFLRGAFSASVMAGPRANLIRYAKALHALEAVLAGHLLAIRSLARTQQHV